MKTKSRRTDYPFETGYGRDVISWLTHFFFYVALCVCVCVCGLIHSEPTNRCCWLRGFVFSHKDHFVPVGCQLFLFLIWFGVACAIGKSVSRQLATTTHTSAQTVSVIHRIRNKKRREKMSKKSKKEAQMGMVYLAVSICVLICLDAPYLSLLTLVGIWSITFWIETIWFFCCWMIRCIITFVWSQRKTWTMPCSANRLATGPRNSRHSNDRRNSLARKSSSSTAVSNR